MFVQQFFVDGLGCASYLIGCEAKGIAAVIDPQRDVRPYLQAANEHSLSITHIIETHLHADHVSGNLELANRTGAAIYLHKEANAEFPHQPLNDGDVLRLGGVKIEVQHTPGHTPESITLLISDTTRTEEPFIALTGDLLFVGDVGRPDLVGLESARSLAKDLYESLFDKVLKMPDSLIVYPGHGAGSLCGRSIGSVRVTTLGYERLSNPSLAVTEKEEFIEYMTNNLPEQPGNHRNVKAMNRRGPRILGDVQPKPLSLNEAIPHFQRGAALLDVRTKDEFVELHVPGSIHIEADDQLSNRIGFVLHPNQPIILMLSDQKDYEKVVYGLARVGYDLVAGYLEGGIQEWQAGGLPVTSGDIQNLTSDELYDLMNNTNGRKPIVIDVREPWEFAQGHIPGAVLIPLGQLSSRVEEIDATQPVAVVCATGNRSQSAAAILGQKGFSKIYNLKDGMYGWQMERMEISYS
ncbi:MAG: MBL fold metallo-hydrolase [Chloroflexi bacterium]|nr:MAG: MBL fold metallo-hydrolase [Chloroflexota bacterium]